MSIDLYTEFFGFRERPFTLLPDPDMLFWSRQHTKAYSILEYGLLSRSPITVVTGEVGTGKTTLIHALLADIEVDTCVGLISNAQGGRGDLLRWVLNALDVPLRGETDYVALFQIFQDHVLAEYALGKHVALIIDEAQNLGADLLEELRMLTNINSHKDTVLQLILLGQPELRDVLSDPSLRQFSQRVGATFHLNPMDAATTQNYIRWRLQKVGGSGQEISPAAVQRIHAQAMGIPRMVNKICDLALVFAATDGSNPMGADIVDELIADGLIAPHSRAPLILMHRIDKPGEAAQ